MAVVLGAIMTTGMAVSAGAAESAQTTYNFTAPKQAKEIEKLEDGSDKYITASVHRAASVLPEILGINTSCGFSMINGSMPSNYDEAKTKLMLGAFGSSANDNPNPYYWNYFYNFYAEENGLAKSQDAVLVPKVNVAASPMMADTTIVDGCGTSISLAARPDILIGTSSSQRGTDTAGYNALISAIRSGAIGEEYYQTGDENYAPYLIGYTTDTTYDMIKTLNEVAEVANKISDETGKVCRYGDPTRIAQDFANYVCGVSTYVLSELENQNLPKKTVAVVQKINSDGTFTLADAASQDATSSVRGVEYVALVSDNLAGKLGKTTVNVDELSTADVIIFSGSNGGGKDDTALPNTRDGVRQAFLKAGKTEADYEAWAADNMIIAENPDSVYGITMNSIENGMGFGYFVGYMYSDELKINPIELCTYFYEKFYHISDRAALQSIVDVTFSKVNLPEGISTTIPVNYSTKKVEAMLAEGSQYYAAHYDQFAGTALTKVWDKDGSPVIEQGISNVYDTANDSGLFFNNETKQYEYRENGTVNTGYTGPVYGRVDGKNTWCYVKNGILDSTKQGLSDVSDASGNWYYFNNGQADYNYTGLANNQNGWWYVRNGQVDFSYTGLVQNAYGWWRIVNGQVDFNSNGLVNSEYGWWYVRGGQIDFTYTGLVQNEYGWWYVDRGGLYFNATGLVQNEYGWWYVQNSQIDFNFTGLVQNEYGWWYVSGGQIGFSCQGVISYFGSWWKITSGKVDFGYTGIAPNEYGWWYVRNGQVDFSYTGLANNENGWWQISQGQVNFNYNGKTTYQGRTYNVVNGKVA